MALSAQGTTLTFAGTRYTVTRVAVSYGGSSNSAGGGGGGGDNRRDRISAAHLDSDPDKPEPFVEIWQPDPLGQGKVDGSGSTSTVTVTTIKHSIDIDFLGASAPRLGSTGTLSIAGPVSLTFTVVTCASSSFSLVVGELVRGSASFTVETSGGSTDYVLL
jgi:hypothetical protein